MSPLFVALAFALLCLARAQSSGQGPRLVVRPAGQDDPSKHLDITGSFSVCPNDVDPEGKITLECAVPGATGPVQMILNGAVVRVENVAPYIINGDTNGFAQPWPVPSGNIVVGCITNLGTFTWDGIFTCSSQASPTPSTSSIAMSNSGPVPLSPSPSSSSLPPPPSNTAPILVVRSAGMDIVANRVPLSDGFSVCADDVSIQGISVDCVDPTGSNPTGVMFFINGSPVQTENVAPFTIAGDSNGIAGKWTPPTGQVTIGCSIPGVGSTSFQGVFTCTSTSPDPIISASSSPSISVTPTQTPEPSANSGPSNTMFETIQMTDGVPIKRHEACGTFCNGLHYIVGGRGANRGIWSFNPTGSKWVERTNPGRELHHMQCVCVNNKIYIPGAWGGGFPNEVPYTQMFVYDTVSDTWSENLSSPGGNRLRGSAALGVFGTKIIMAAGSTGGHGASTTLVPYTDVFDTANPSAGWVAKDDIIDPRDHTGGAVVGNYFCVAGGRDGAQPGFDFWKSIHQTNPINCFDLSTETWTQKANLTVPRGGVAVGASPCGDYLMVAGGEVVPEGEALFASRPASKRVDLFDPVANKFLDPIFMQQGRHGTGLGVTDCSCGNVYIAGGSGQVGGSPELNDIEVWRAQGPRKIC